MKDVGFRDKGDSLRNAESKKKLDKIRAFRNQKLEKVMQDPDGRFVIASIIEKCGVFLDVHVTNSDIYRHAGMRTVGLWLRDWIIDASFGSYVTMLEELKEYESKDRDTSER